MTSNIEFKVSEIKRDRHTRIADASVNRKKFLIPGFNALLKTKADFDAFVDVKTNYGCPHLGSLTVRLHDVDDILVKVRTELAEGRKRELFPTARTTNLSKTFDETVVWIDPYGEATYYENRRQWDKIVRSVEVHPVIRNYIQGLIDLKKKEGVTDEESWQTRKEAECTKFWLSLLDDTKLFQEVISYTLESEAKNGADAGITIGPPLYSSEIFDVIKKSNRFASWIWRNRMECALSITLTPQIFSNDDLLEDVIEFIEKSPTKPTRIGFKGLNLANADMGEQKNRCRYMQNKFDIIRQKDPSRFFMASGCGHQAYPFAVYGFDVVGTSLAGRDDEGGGRGKNKEFIGYSSYYSRLEMIRIPYRRIYHETFPSLGRLPCDCPACTAVTDLNAITRGYWNFNTARPHFANTWNGFLAEISQLVRDDAIQKAKGRLLQSDLCALKRLIPDN